MSEALQRDDRPDAGFADAAVEASEARFRALVERTSDLIAILEPDGTNRYASPSHGPVLGVSPTQLVGLCCFDFVHPEDLGSVREGFARAMADGNAFLPAVRFLVAAPGSRRPTNGARAETAGPEPTQDASGRAWRTLAVHLTDLRHIPAVGGIVANSRDVTAERQWEAQDRVSTALLAAAFRASRDAIALYRRDTGQILAVNDSWLAATGHTRHAVLGRPQQEVALWASNDAARFLSRLSQDGDVRDFVFRFHRADRTAGWAVLQANCLDLDGVPCVLTVARDVTEERRLEEELRQAQKLEALGRLAGGIAHDFNNLLLAIQANLEFLDTDLPADLPRTHPARADVQEIADAAARARGLVRQLMAFSRKQPVHARPVDLGALVADAEVLLRRIVGEEVALAVHVERGPTVVHADPAQLEQVLVNLAVNARDALRTARHGHPGRGGTLFVDVLPVARSDAPPTPNREGRDPPQPPAGWVDLVVRDTGHGMSEEERTRAFEPFYTTKGVGHGTGLGLATVFGIVHQAGGSIHVESAPGAGSTFRVRLPTLPPAQAVQATTHGTLTHDQSTGAAAGLGGLDVLAGSVVLLAEDERPVRMAIRGMLERAGCTVLDVRHGADALRVWRAETAAAASDGNPGRPGGRIMALVTDLRMPTLGGHALAAQMRDERPGLPVVFLSGYTPDDEPHAEGAAGNNANDAASIFVEKPFRGADLLGALAHVVARAERDHQIHRHQSRGVCADDGGTPSGRRV